MIHMSTFDTSNTDQKNTDNSNQDTDFRNTVGEKDIPSHTSVSQRKKPSKPTYGTNDSIFAWLSIVVCILFVHALPIVENTLGGVLSVIMLFGFATLYFVFSKVRLKAPTVTFGIIICILSVGLITGANTVIHRLLFLFVILAYLYYIYCASGLSEKYPISNNSILYALRAVFVLPFSRPHAIFCGIIAQKGKGRRFLRTLVFILLGLLVAIVPTTVVILLLSYDGSFTALLKKIFFLSFKDVLGYALDIFLGAILSVFLFSAIFSSQWKYHTRNENTDRIHKLKTQILPKALLCAALTPILIVYVIFFISQWNYYISAFTNIRPDDLTLSEYARNGFFELCWVSGINAVMLLLFRIFARRKDGEKGILQAVYSSLISIFTLILIATAISKMALYIKTYGLTQKRVYATLLMLLLATIFIAVLLSQFIKKIRLIPVIIILCIVFGGIIALPDVDGMIATYNVDSYLAGDLDSVDISTLSSYGVSSVPALVDLRDTLRERPQLTQDEKDILNNTDLALNKIKTELSSQPNTFFTFNIPTARARSLLK